MVANRTDLPRDVAIEDSFEKASDLGMCYEKSLA